MRKFSLGAMVITGVLSVAPPAMAGSAAVSYPAPPTAEAGSAGTGTGPNGQVTVSSTVICNCAPGKSASAGTTTGAETTSAGTTSESTTSESTTGESTTGESTTGAGPTTAGTASTGSAAIPAVSTTVAGAST